MSKLLETGSLFILYDLNVHNLKKKKRKKMWTHLTVKVYMVPSTSVSSVVIGIWSLL